MINGAAMSWSLVALAMMGQPFPDLAPASSLLVGGHAFVGALFLLVECQVNHGKWAEWARYMTDKTVWDIITGRHIPRLRDEGV